MTKLYKIFVCEFITGGGLSGEPLPESLASEGALMRDALLRDLAELPYEINTCVDYRLPIPTVNGACQVINAQDDVWPIWLAQIKATHAVLLIAPETDGILSKLTQIASLSGASILGCRAEEVSLFSDKMATFLALKQANIASIESELAEKWLSHKVENNTKWLAKPIDGAGCEDTFCFERATDLRDWILQNNKQNTHIIQPFIVGVTASISCIIQNGVAYMLTCNQQIIGKQANQLQFNGCIINGMQQHRAAFEALANRIAQAFSRLAGYVGIDVIVNGDDIVVVEVNPRLTTSYAGLREATGQNVAELLLNSFIKPDFRMPILQHKQVTIYV